MKIFILDDEKLASEYLKETISEVIVDSPKLSQVSIKSFNTYKQFLDSFVSEKPEIIFLDIEMPGKNGLEVAKVIQEMKIDLGYQDNFPVIIFSTAHEEFGFEAYQLGVFDYILKPCNKGIVSKALEKVVNFYNINIPKQNYITVSHAGLTIKIPLNEVVYFKAEMKYITIVTENKEYLLNDTLSNLELKFGGFLRVHRSFLVNERYIKKVLNKESHWQAILTNGVNIPISRRYKAILDQTVDYRKFL